MKNKIIIILIFLFIVGCQTYDNFVTYFNTFYNMNKLMEKSEDEFEFLDESVRSIKIYVPEPRIYESTDHSLGPPAFMKEFIIDQRKRQPVKIKLDSIIIKGSKILANSPKSDYVEGSLFLMAKSYFYQNEWRLSQIKCSELVDVYPGGDYSPDAHLLYAKNALIQRNFHTGKIMLSRTVDIAWQKNRYDILSEAFRIQAELALYQNDLEGAIRPYKQAVMQADDYFHASLWQIELGSLLYRISEFERAIAEFERVEMYSPDYEGIFESRLYTAMSHIRIGNYKKADEILTELEKDGKWEEWKPYTFAARMTMFRLQGDEKKIEIAENFADTTYTNNPLITTYYFERGMDYYAEDDYLKSMQYLAKSRHQRTPIFQVSNDLFKILSDLDYNRSSGIPEYEQIKSGEMDNDTLKYGTASALYNVGRAFEKLKRMDSARAYYDKAFEVCPKSWEISGKFLYNSARMYDGFDQYKADSLFEVLAENYTLSEYGKIAMEKLGFTENYAVDTLQELFSSGMRLREYGDYFFSNEQFYQIYLKYPDKELAPRALYNIGWNFERKIKNLDSALLYYDILVGEYPESIYAQDLLVGLAYLKNKLYDEPIPDSLKFDGVMSATTGKKEEVEKKEPEEQKPRQDNRIRRFKEKTSESMPLEEPPIESAPSNFNPNDFKPDLENMKFMTPEEMGIPSLVPDIKSDTTKIKNK